LTAAVEVESASGLASIDIGEAERSSSSSDSGSNSGIADSVSVASNKADCKVDAVQRLGALRRLRRGHGHARGHATSALASRVRGDLVLSLALITIPASAERRSGRRPIGAVRVSNAVVESSAIGVAEVALRTRELINSGITVDLSGAGATFAFGGAWNDAALLVGSTLASSSMGASK